MKSQECFSILILTGICFLMGPVPAFAEEEALVPLIDKISQRINSYPENNNYEVIVLTENTEMNKQWEPKKTTTIKTIIKRRNGDEEREILEATETENGKTSDVTGKFAERAERQKDKTRHDAENKQVEKEKRNLLFVKEMRMEFDFEVLPEGNFVVKKMTAKAVAKIVFKTIRQITKIEYYDYAILHPDTS